MGSITSANAVISITVDGLFPAPVMLSGFAADDAFSSAALQLSESRMGVDGVLSSGFVFNPFEFNIVFNPDSVSIGIFNTIVNAMISARDVFKITISIFLQSTGMTYLLRNGALQEAKIIPDGKKMLDPQPYKIITETPVIVQVP